MSYVFKYRRFLPRKIKDCEGHNYNKDMDRMDVFHKRGLVSIPNWSRHTLILGQDFIAFEKKNIKQESHGRADL